MTANNPPIAVWAPSTALAKLASRHNNAPCVLTDGPAEFNDVALVRLSDYEALQSTHEEELFQVRQTRDTHFGSLMRALEQVDALQVENAQLRAAIRRLCNTYEVDDYYMGQLREERLDAAVSRAIDAAPGLLPQRNRSMSERYKAVEGTESGHDCCFEAMVVDTQTPNPIFPDVVCECYDMEIAQKIADALNAALDEGKGARGGGSNARA